MAVIEDLITGGDGLVQAATICITTGITSRPITELYSLELNEAEGANIRVRKSTTVQLTDPAELQAWEEPSRENLSLES